MVEYLRDTHKQVRELAEREGLGKAQHEEIEAAAGGYMMVDGGNKKGREMLFKLFAF